ncbi:MAG: hypothetical protein HZA54_16835 [Planctomycetes bacterium]|nr:hypothetical protein [Planctomycetota bacterium]
MTGGVREHFRPKAHSAANANAWENLRLGCHECNGNKERMKGGSQAAPSSQCCLLDPCSSGFRTEDHFKTLAMAERGRPWQVLYLQGVTPEGKEVIDFLKLGPGSVYPSLRGEVLDRYRKTRDMLAALEAKGATLTKADGHRLRTLQRQITSILGDATSFIGALRLHLRSCKPPAAVGPL